MTPDLERQIKEYEYLCSSLPDPMVVLSTEGEFLMVSKKLEELSEYNAKKLIGKKIFDLPLVSKKDLPGIRDKIKKTLRGEKIPIFELEITTRTGRKLIGEINNCRITFRGEKAILAVIRDTTKQKEMEREIRENRERLAFLFSAGPAVIYVSRAFGDFGATFISENVQQQTGYKSEEFIEDSKFWISHVHPDDAGRVLKEMDKIFKKKKNAYQYRFKYKDGSYRWMFDEAKLIEDKKGKPKEIIGYWVDITKRKKAEEKLNMKIMELERTNKLMVGRELKMIELKKKLKNK